MAVIQKANVVLRVKDSEVEYYLNLGYNLIDDKGRVIKESVPNDLHLLQKHFVESSKLIETLKLENEALKNEIKELREEHTETTKPATVERPVRGRKAKE